MKKPFFRASMTGLLFVVVYYAIQVIQGLYHTANFVPDLSGQYKASDSLQDKIAFGSAGNPVWSFAEVTGVLLLGIVVYYVGRVLYRLNSK